MNEKVGAAGWNRGEGAARWQGEESQQSAKEEGSSRVKTGRGSSSRVH